MTVFLFTLAIVGFFVATIALREERAARLGARPVGSSALIDAPRHSLRERTEKHLAPPTGSPVGVAHAPPVGLRR